METTSSRPARVALAVLIACVALVPRPVLAGERPVIERARVYVSGSRIVTDVDCRALISEQIAGTVESGLPAVVELAYRLRHRNGGDAGRGVHVLRLRYDVWDDVYSLERGDTAETFDSFATLRHELERLRKVPIVAVNRVEPAGVYRIALSVSVHALRGDTEPEIVGWVDDTVRDSEGAWHEQLLNVNGLIHRFFSRDRSDDNQSEWFETILFTPASLPLERAGDVGGDRR